MCIFGDLLPQSSNDVYTLFQNGRHFSILLFLAISFCYLVLKLEIEKNIFPLTKVYDLINDC